MEYKWNLKSALQKSGQAVQVRWKLKQWHDGKYKQLITKPYE